MRTLIHGFMRTLNENPELISETTVKNRLKNGKKKNKVLNKFTFSANLKRAEMSVLLENCSEDAGRHGLPI